MNSILCANSACSLLSAGSLGCVREDSEGTRRLCGKQLTLEVK